MTGAIITENTVEFFAELHKEAASWIKKAACRGLPTRWFYGDRGPSMTRIARAKSICGVCTVRKECFDLAVNAKEDYGIWGGLEPDERAR